MTTSTPEAVRRAVVAGTWYPGTERSLRQTVDGFLARAASPPLAGDLLGLISPHAGYAYSGQTAAHAYGQLHGRAFDTVVIMAPSHRMLLDDYATNLEDAYETPLGRVPLDRAFIADLARRLPLQTIRADSEHSLEIQLPFLQVQLGAFALVPILMSADTPAAAQRLAGALADTIRLRSAAGARCLLVASSDLHHVENYDEVVSRDRAVVDAVAAFDLEALTPLFMDRRCTVCGRMPILAALHACRSLGADSVRVLHHTNSGDVTGERRAGQYTVGYMAAAVLACGARS
jgi:AmmeMemoRadiSam system protein B